MHTKRMRQHIARADRAFEIIYKYRIPMSEMRTLHMYDRELREWVHDKQTRRVGLLADCIESRLPLIFRRITGAAWDEHIRIGTIDGRDIIFGFKKRKEGTFTIHIYDCRGQYHASGGNFRDMKSAKRSFRIENAQSLVSDEYRCCHNMT